MSEASGTSYIGDLIKGYDELMYPLSTLEYVSENGFFNFGYWERDTADQARASENLVKKLLAFVSEKRGAILDVACGKGFPDREELLESLEEYGDVLRRADFPDATVVDATKERWEGQFWYAVNSLHRPFFARQIDRTTMEAVLQKLYQLVPDAKAYVLAAAQKGPR